VACTRGRSRKAVHTVRHMLHCERPTKGEGSPPLIEVQGDSPRALRVKGREGGRRRLQEQRQPCIANSQTFERQSGMLYI